MDQTTTGRLERIEERIGMLRETIDAIRGNGVHYGPVAIQWEQGARDMLERYRLLREVVRFNAGYPADAIPRPAPHDGIIEEADPAVRLASMRANGATPNNLRYEEARLMWLRDGGVKPDPAAYNAVDYSVFATVPRLTLNPIPDTPAMPAMPSMPATPQAPAMPTMPAMPSMPATMM